MKANTPRKDIVKNFGIFHGFLKCLGEKIMGGGKFGLDILKFEKFKKMYFKLSS